MRIPLFGQLILASSVILVSPSGVVHAQAEQQNFSIRVQVSVKTKNETVKSKIVSYVSRELRSLGDVVVTDHGPHFRLRIVAVEVAFVSGTPTGTIPLSTVLTMPLKITGPLITLKELLKGQYFQLLLIDSLEGQDMHVAHWVHTGATKDLRSMCETFVATIDSTYFEAVRRDWQTSQDELSKEKQ